MSAPPERPFPSLPGYEVLEVIGEGGMGTVYRAHDIKHDRQVAIKTIRQDLVNPAAIGRFEREIRLTSSLQHPRILPLLDSGYADGTLYYVMQFIDGESLQDRLNREGALPLEDALRITRHVADALDCAHTRGIVHRDVKPANILLSGGHALVMDFGIGRALVEGNTSLTSTGSAIGTPKYMSPEQISDSTTVDGRADIYSLGCVLYEMIAGHPPFTGRSVDSILRQHLTADPPRLDVHRPGTPPEVEAIVERTMAKSPPDRFASAGQLAGELEALSTRGVVVEAPRRIVRNGIVVTAAYLLGAWAIVAILERVVETASLPDWTIPFALVLLMIGLLVVMATAVIQATGGTRGTATDPGTTGSGRGRPARRKKSLGSFFRWRNVAAGGVLALALWGIVASVALFRQGRFSSETTGRRLSSADSDAAAPGEGDDASAGGETGDRDGTGADGSTGRQPEAGDDSSALASDAGGLEARDPATERDGASDDSGASTAGGTTPSTAAPPPAAGGERGTERMEMAREGAEAARARAEGAGARLVPAPSLGRADSLWADAVRLEAGGRPADASASFELARIAYGDAGREAAARVRLRLDTIWRRVDSLRARADPANPPFAEAERLREQGQEAEDRGDLVDALQSLGEAGRHYNRALPFVELPPPYDEDVEDDEPDDPEAVGPTPEERIEAVMSALERAFEAEDPGAIRRIWVDLDDTESGRFRDFFDNGSEVDYAYTVEPGSIRPVGRAVEFRVTVRWSYRDDRGDRVTSPEDVQSFRLEDLDGRDVLRRLP